MLNNNQLARLYIGFERDYQNLCQQGISKRDICLILGTRLNQSFSHSDSTLYLASEDTRRKAYIVLDSFLNSKPAGLPISPHFKFDMQSEERLYVYCLKQDAFFNWRKLDAFMSYSAYAPKPKSRMSYVAAGALMFVLGICEFILTAICLYYILSQTLNSLERIIFNEGWQQAAITLASIVAGGFAGVFLGVCIASTPVFFPALLPLSIAVSTLAIIGSAVSCRLTNWIQIDRMEKEHPTALDPRDPHRFVLTAKEEENLISKQIDPVKALCAITALRMRIDSEGIPSFFNRMLFKKSNLQHQDLLLIRQIRSGTLQQVNVGDLSFDLIETHSDKASASFNPFGYSA